MHDTTLNQASGLGRLTNRIRGARLLAMVSHGDDQTELPLLWRLCLAWVEFGYPVTVLDATTSENSGNPGLEQLLECPYLPSGGTPDAVAWNVLPAAVGIRSLCDDSCTFEQLRRKLNGIFSEDGVVIIYGKAEWLSTLLSGSGIQPVMVVSSAKQSLITSYMALKRILAGGDLQPVVVTARPGSIPSKPQSDGDVGWSLAECAKNFLGYELKISPLSICRDDAPTTPDLLGLSLRVLESAHPLSMPWVYPSSQHAMDTATRSH